MANSTVNSEERGKVLDIVFVVQYPDGAIKTVHYDAQNIASIMLDEGQIIEHLGPDATKRVWNTGDVSTNPAMIVHLKEGQDEICKTVCAFGGHRTGHVLTPENRVVHD